ncbi:M24 family metallopeptidase [Halomonas alimentaria]|uniref:M24 family metallopeptidase n=1 Tax=Halomonas alimentaria TaxID=147248 RepID=UPI0024907A8F|nr:Xaa-Pro peptidase family protein [Halomonas alimentaria]
MNNEYQNRYARLQASIARRGFDAALITSTDSIYYLTGFRYLPFERAFFIVVRPEGEMVIVTPRIEAENMATITLPHRIVEYTDYPAPSGETYMDALGSVISPSEKIAVEPSMPAELMVATGEYNPEVVPLIETLRLVKSKDEIRRVQTAAKYSDLGLRMIMEAAKLGTTIKGGYDRIPELRSEIMKGEGAFDQYTSSIWLGVWAAPFSAQPHRFPEPTDIFREGPNVGLSFLRVNGYSAETERTFFLHEPSAEEAEVFATMLAACDIAYGMLKPGVSAHEVDHQVMSFLRSEGFENNLLHRVGHGIGLGGHEGPWLAEGSDDVLEENMIISIEPGIYWRGQGGFRHSDTVLITSDGYRQLTDFPRDIKSMTLA